ncbi:MAG TPA: zinc ABC transporter substrate-binding protein [Kiritimatiellia bacterium]|nr:zinc ABC transporter substrate-binding protein [Kiritimatiellia bacterium]HRZ13257.1 zinc ABC transporter substrate-binding protein [Kiritimatiellia bacterium]HSA18706.1 zinc ABC transporter substrate-binding protein [Kiritimatiellia bacterium]
MRNLAQWTAWMALACAAAIAARAEPVRVVTTIFPLYDWARAVGGERVDVAQLLPPGVEAHSYAPRPSDVFALNRADVFLYLGADLEPWAADLVRGIENPRVAVIEAGREVPREHGHDEDDEEDGEHHHEASDPHIWLDPVLAQTVVSTIAAGLAQADPAGAAEYAARAGRYNAQLAALDEDIRAGLANCRHRQILYGGHFAFGYFARRYGLTHLSPYAGFSPNAAPTPAQMAELVKAIRASGQTTLFVEELLDPKVGRTLAEETGTRLEVLHGAHNLTREERTRGDVTYLSLMRENLAKLRKALGCE